MSRVPWHLFKHRQPQSHLVAAVLSAESTGADSDPKRAQVVLVRLVRAQKPASYFATAVVREAGRPEVHLAFEDKGDARQLVTALKGKRTINNPGWATEWTLQLTAEMVRELAASLPAPKSAKRQAAPDDSSEWIRGRRGRRIAPVRRYEEE
jgi:hypothetical protein